jgi:hypothetical protein
MEALVASVKAIPGFSPTALFAFFSKYATMLPQIATFFAANGGSLQSVLTFFTANGGSLQTVLTDLMNVFGVVVPTPVPPTPPVP